MKTGESSPPQFATAEYAPGSSTMKCAACQHAIAGSYFQIKGAPVCADCAEKIRAQAPRDSHGSFVRALLFGIAGALVGLVLYVTFALSTGLIIGWVSLAVGFIVGKAMHMGSHGVGGRRYQVAAALLTYFAVSMSAVPIAVVQSRQNHRAQVQSVEIAAQPRTQMGFGEAIGALALIGIASPLLDLRDDPVHGLIGLVILFVGIRFAWTFTAGRTVNISGPYTGATPGAT
jgi:uncharacterized protein (DUF983 family)